MVADKAGEIPVSPSRGLTSTEAAERLERYGPNMAPEERRRPLLGLLGKFWAPVPWMLEATIILELLLGHYAEAEIIGLLLVVNAILSFVQEGRAHNALALLRQRLTIQARVLRDGQWQLRPAQELVPGDVVRSADGRFGPGGPPRRIGAGPSRSVGANRRVRAGRSRQRASDLRGNTGQTGRGERRDHCYGHAHHIRKDRGIGPPGEDRQPP